MAPKASAILSNAQFIIDIGQDVARLTGVPGLGLGLKVLSNILTKVKNVSDNSDNMKDLASNIHALVLCIVSTKKYMTAAIYTADNLTVVRKREIALQESEEFKERVEELKKDLLAIDQKSSDLLQGCYLTQFLMGDENATKLASLNQDVKNTLTKFQIKGQISIEMIASEILRKVDGFENIVEGNLKKERIYNDAIRAYNSLPRAPGNYDSIDNPAHRLSAAAGTFSDVFNDIDQWTLGKDQDSEKKFIYMIAGVPGSGRSTIAHDMAKKLDEANLLGGSFFFVRNDSTHFLNTTRLLVPTLAWQIGYSRPEVKEDVGRAALWYNSPRSLEKELEKLIMEPLKGPHHQRSDPLFIVLDGLDQMRVLADRRFDHTEEVKEVAFLLHHFARCIREIPFLRLLVTTSLDTQDDELLHSSNFWSMTKVYRMMGNRHQGVSKDMHLTLKQGFSHLLAKNEILVENPDAISILALKSQGNLIFVSAVLKVLQAYPTIAPQLIDAFLSQDSDYRTHVEQDLDRFYRLALKYALDDLSHRRITASRTIRRILSSIVLAKADMSPDTLGYLTDVAIADINAIVKQLRGFIQNTTCNSLIQLYHRNFRDFITDDSRCIDMEFYVDPGTGNARIALDCLSKLSRPLEDHLLWTRSARGAYSTSVIAMPEYLHHACTYWAEYVNDAVPTTELLNGLETFLSHRFLIWVEAMSVLDKLEAASWGLMNVEKWYNDNAADNFHKETWSFLHDGRIFVQKNENIFREHPTEVYTISTEILPHSKEQYYPIRTNIGRVPVQERYSQGIPSEHSLHLNQQYYPIPLVESEREPIRKQNAQVRYQQPYYSIDPSVASVRMPYSPIPRAPSATLEHTTYSPIPPMISAYSPISPKMPQQRIYSPIPPTISGSNNQA